MCAHAKETSGLKSVFEMRYGKQDYYAKKTGKKKLLTQNLLNFVVIVYRTLYPNGIGFGYKCSLHLFMV